MRTNGLGFNCAATPAGVAREAAPAAAAAALAAQSLRGAVGGACGAACGSGGTGGCPPCGPPRAFEAATIPGFMAVNADATQVNIRVLRSTHSGVQGLVASIGVATSVAYGTQGFLLLTRAVDGSSAAAVPLRYTPGDGALVTLDTPTSLMPTGDGRVVVVGAGVVTPSTGGEPTTGPAVAVVDVEAAAVGACALAVVAIAVHEPSNAQYTDVVPWAPPCVRGYQACGQPLAAQSVWLLCGVGIATAHDDTAVQTAFVRVMQPLTSPAGADVGPLVFLNLDGGAAAGGNTNASAAVSVCVVPTTGLVVVAAAVVAADGSAQTVLWPLCRGVTLPEGSDLPLLQQVTPWNATGYNDAATGYVPLVTATATTPVRALAAADGELVLVVNAALDAGDATPLRGVQVVKYTPDTNLDELFGNGGVSTWFDPARGASVAMDARFGAAGTGCAPTPGPASAISACGPCCGGPPATPASPLLIVGNSFVQATTDDTGGAVQFAVPCLVNASLFVPGPLSAALTLGGPSPFVVEVATTNPGGARQVVAGLPGCAALLWASSLVVMWPEPLVVVTGDATFGVPSILGTSVPHVLTALVRLARGSPPRVLNCGPAPCAAAAPPVVVAVDNKCCPTALFLAGALVLGDGGDARDGVLPVTAPGPPLPGSIRFNAAAGVFEGCVDASGTWLAFAFATG
jgi:hypothetical protein